MKHHDEPCMVHHCSAPERPSLQARVARSETDDDHANELSTAANPASFRVLLGPKIAAPAITSPFPRASTDDTMPLNHRDKSCIVQNPAKPRKGVQNPATPQKGQARDLARALSHAWAAAAGTRSAPRRPRTSGAMLLM